MKIESGIHHLLYTHDCVIVPGFGGFVANYKPASIHPTQHTFSPPSKNIAFNRSLQNNDGLLTMHVSVKDKLSYPEAGKLISNQVTNWKENLDAGKKLPLDQIGTLYFDVEKNLRFEPSNEVNYLLDSFGMVTVQSPAIRRDETLRELKNKTAEPRIESLVPSKKKGMGLGWKVAATILMTLTIAEISYVSYKSGLLESNKINYSYLNPFSDSSWFHPKKEIAKPAVMPEVSKENNSLPEGKWTAPIESPAVVTEEAVAPETTEPSTEVAVAESTLVVNETPTPAVNDSFLKSGKFDVVAGCFQYEENAQRLLSTLRAKGYPAAITGKTRRGLTIVSFSTFESITEARALLSKVKMEEDSSAWLNKN